MTDVGRTEPALRVAVLHHPTNAGHAATLGAFLEAARVEIVDADAQPDGMVVLLSESGLAQPEWLRTTLRGRIVPVRIERFDERPLPPVLKELNWLDWPPGDAGPLLGRVLAALAADPHQRDLLRQLTHEAQAWHEGGRSQQLLMDDYRRARRMKDMLDDLAASDSAVVPPGAADFVERSVAELTTRRRKRRRRAILAGVAVCAVLAALVTQLPRLRLAGRNNKQAITTTGDRDVLAWMPEWSAINSAALILNGGEEARVLARQTLISALNVPWRISKLNNIRGVTAVAPFDRGRRAVVAFRTGSRTTVAVVDVRSTEIAWTLPLPGVFDGLCVTADGTVALAVGDTGGVRVDLAARTARPIATGVRFVDAYLVDERHAVARVRGDQPKAAVVDTGSGTVLASTTAPSVLAVGAAAGRAVALVASTDRRLRLVEVLSGRTVAATSRVPYDDGNGAISPDGRSAIVEGSDGQLWTFGRPSAAGAARSGTPTGIPVPFAGDGILWAGGDRVAVYSDDRMAQVYSLSRAEPLGTVCADLPQPVELRLAAGSDVVGCLGEAGSSFWRLPPGPMAARPPGGSSAGSASAAGVSVRSSGGRVRVTTAGFGPTDWFPVIGGQITAVAVGADGTRVIVGNTAGTVAVLDVKAGRVTTAGRWRTPDRATVTGVGWDGGPYATTATGQVWRVPDCGACDSDAGLLATFRARISGCFIDRQLASIDADTLRRLGVRRCAPQIGGV